MDILSLLKEKGVLDDQAVATITEAAASGGKSIEALLLERGVTPEIILEAQGEYYQMPVRDVGSPESIPHDALEYIPEESARH